jgi:hypothetical protein
MASLPFKVDRREHLGAGFYRFNQESKTCPIKLETSNDTLMRQTEEEKR